MRCVTLLISLIVLVGGTVAYAAEPLPAPKGPVLLTITGRIEQTNAPGEARFDREMLEGLGQSSITTSSQVSEPPQRFEGVPLRAVLDRVGARGRIIKGIALNDYHANLPWDDLQYNLLLATHVDGQVLKARDKGPLWIVYPRDDHPALQTQLYDSRWVWQLNRLQVD